MAKKPSPTNQIPEPSATPSASAAQTPSTRSAGMATGQARSPMMNQNQANLYGGGSYGMLPEMSAGMTFAEIGSPGLRAFSGWVREEFLPELIGRQGAQKYREMSDNSPVIGAIVYAIKSTMRKVEWRVIPAGAEENKRTSP